MFENVQRKKRSKYNFLVSPNLFRTQEFEKTDENNLTETKLYKRKSSVVLNHFMHSLA